MIHLILFFTRGVSLQTWAKNGSLEREIVLYLRLQQEKNVRISFITYGNKADLQYRDKLQGIEILCNRWNLSLHRYEQLIPFLHARALSRTNLIKTNQTNGADVALRAARLWRKPLIARCGYMWSDLAKSSGRQAEAALARRIEKKVFTNARHIAVTTLSMKEFVVRKYGIPSRNVHVIPNYVLTNRFLPLPQELHKKQICFIGRLSEEKNLLALVEACADLDVELIFIGEGHLRVPLQECAKQFDVKLTLKGTLPHNQLPDMIRQSAFFALVSPHEGHPKSLLEAMSCGVAVLGANSPGIREQIVHRETGWLVGTDVASIRAGIQHLLANPSLCKELGRNARHFILENYSLDKIVEMEYSVLKEVVNLEPETLDKAK